MERRAFLVGLPLALAGCTGQSVWAPEADVQRAVYRHDAPSSLTLYTVKNVGSEAGAHTGLLINASQRVIFDPAGSFGHASIPERNDVLFGITPRIEQFYTSYHARTSYFMIKQAVQVPPEVAERTLRLAMEYGAVAKANCTRATSDILKQLPGFERIRLTFLPDNLERQFERLPGMQRSEHREDDPDDNRGVLATIGAEQ